MKIIPKIIKGIWVKLQTGSTWLPCLSSCKIILRASRTMVQDHHVSIRHVLSTTNA